MTSRRPLCTRLLAGLGLACALFNASAQDFPNKPIRMLVPFAPGGPADVIARPLADGLQSALGQPIIVDYKPGAGAITAVQSMLSAPADGYTILVGSNVLALAMSLYKKAPYDVSRDLRGVVSVTMSPYVVLVPAAFPASNIGELIAAAKAAPGKLNFATSGPGTLSHVAAELFNQSAGIKLAHIPYKGAGPATTALLGGEVQVFFDAVFSAQAQIKSGRIKALAVTSLQRVDSMPTVRTADEQGLKGFQVASWFGIVAAKGVPDAIIERLNAGLNKALQSQQVKERFATIGAAPAGGTAAGFQKQIEDEVGVWGRVIQASGITLD